jgi:immune inhibitor A
MKARFGMTFVALITMMVSLMNVMPVHASIPLGDRVSMNNSPQANENGIFPKKEYVKPMDQPNPIALDKLQKRAQLIAQGDTAAADALATVNDRILVILVEFAGTDKVTWEPGDQWDPYGSVDPNDVSDTDDPCAKIAADHNLTSAKEFTYGPLMHNEIERPLSATDASANTIWTPDFTSSWYKSFMFGSGVKFDYTRQDSSTVYEDFTGKSVKNYYQDMSGGKYNINGDVIGWVSVPHSPWYYGADACPGARSAGLSSYADTGALDSKNHNKMGTPGALVRDAIDAVDEMSNTIPGFDWSNYDLDGDGIVDHLWIVHAGYGEEDNATLLSRTDYGEAAVWSHSSSIAEYAIGTSGVSASPYIIMPENGGIGVFAHEFGHNIGTMDLYAYNEGETSAGFWTLMADDWVGYPLGFQPPSLDPYHLDQQGWLEPYEISDPSQVYTVTVGQASDFPGGAGVYRGVKIDLPQGEMPQPVTPNGSYYWWGGKQDQTNSRMTLKDAIAVPAGGATLSLNLAYEIEPGWDFLWVQASPDNGTTWNTLTNSDTVCDHETGWIGELNGFPADLCAAGMGGFTDYNASYPDFDAETFNLDAATYGGKNVLVRFWYMTDWGTTKSGPFIDDVTVKAGSATLFSDDAESGAAKWTYTGKFALVDSLVPFSQNYYLQFRNTSSTGGYDSGLGDSRFRYGPANSGLLVWYNNNYYTDNEGASYMTDWPSFGPKGRMLVIDSHPEPMRDPAMIEFGYDNEAGNINSRASMRDATFSKDMGQNYTAHPPYAEADTTFEGKPGVSSFDDSLGYYAGAEYVSRGPGYSPASWKWVTAQWDGSAVVPSTRAYAFKAPGYGATDQLRWDCLPYTGNTLGCYHVEPGLGYDGGTGNPGDTGGQLGWHVDIVSQTASTATLRIYNTNAVHVFQSDKTNVTAGKQVSFSYTINNYPTSTTHVFACTNLDTNIEQLINATGATYLTSPCETFAGMSTQSMDQATTTDPTKAVAVAMSRNIQTGADAGFTFTVWAKSATTFTQKLNVYDGLIHRVYNSDVTIDPVSLYIPIIRAK